MKHDIEIIRHIPNFLQGVLIKDTLSKHILYRGELEERYDRVCMLGGHIHTKWGEGMGNTDVVFQQEYIRTMLREKHMYPVKFLIVRHPDTGKHFIWCDNMHHTLMQCKMLGWKFEEIKITDLMSYYVVNIMNPGDNVVYDPDYNVREDEIHKVFEKEYQKTWFRDAKILDFSYTMGKFIEQNREWYDNI